MLMPGYYRTWQGEYIVTENGDPSTKHLGRFPTARDAKKAIKAIREALIVEATKRAMSAAEERWIELYSDTEESLE